MITLLVLLLMGAWKLLRLAFRLVTLPFRALFRRIFKRKKSKK